MDENTVMNIIIASEILGCDVCHKVVCLIRDAKLVQTNKLLSRESQLINLTRSTCLSRGVSSQTDTRQGTVYTAALP